MDRLDRVATLMDSRFQIPGTRIRFGADAIIGLIPGVGDVAAASLAVYIIWRARKLGISRWAQTRMVTNMLLDTTIGAIPLVGDAFDVWLKANKRNVGILRKELACTDRYPQSSNSL